jgi:hypothetical protein
MISSGLHIFGGITQQTVALGGPLQRMDHSPVNFELMPAVFSLYAAAV